MADKTSALIRGAGERGNPRDTSPPPWRGRFCSFGFPDSRSAPHYASSEQHGGQPGTERPRTSLKGLDSLKSRSSFSESAALRSEEHTSELQSLTKLVCRLLLENKKSQ